jgi:glycosyltransferase involved in cell wall biosynthesis
MNQLRHSILVVSYNQEAFIVESLNSVINQSELPYEIIIGDDCSTDNTWSIISMYCRNYPKLITAYKNDVNIGLFHNINKIKRMAKGDIVSFLAGDDMLDLDFIKNIDRFQEENESINSVEKYLIITNSIIIENEKNKYIDNSKYEKQNKIKSLLRGNLVIWDTGISSGLLHSMPDWETNIGNHADSLQFFERFLMADYVYFLPVVGYKYRRSVGVTVRTELKEQTQSYYQVLLRIKSLVSNTLDSKDTRYLNFLISYYSYISNPSIVKYLVLLYGRLKCDLQNDSIYRNIKLYIPIKLKRILKYFLLLK